MTKKQKLTLMLGNSHSGKSTWITQNNKGKAIVVCPDTIRKVIFGHQFHKEAEEFIWGITKAMIHILMLQGKDVILDATCLKTSIRYQYWTIADQYKAIKEIVWIQTPVEICLRRNKTDTIKRVPENVIVSMDSMLEPPEECEADSVIIVCDTKNKGRK